MYVYVCVFIWEDDVVNWTLLMHGRRGARRTIVRRFSAYFDFLARDKRYREDIAKNPEGI